jgi:hypothetical protein
MPLKNHDLAQFCEIGRRSFGGDYLIPGNPAIAGRDAVRLSSLM